MTAETRYRYEKRIKSLEAEVERLRDYRAVVINIRDGVISCVKDNSSISKAWILEQMNRLLK